jgi:Tfp pilus assembly protein PilX
MRPAGAAHVMGARAFGEGSEHIRKSGVRAKSLDEPRAAIQPAPAAALAGNVYWIEAAGCESESAGHRIMSIRNAKNAVRR